MVATNDDRFLAPFIGHLNGFDWDEGNRQKCLKHGVSARDIEALFLSGLRVRPDMTHSSVEARFQAVGVTDSGRSVFLVFTVRRRLGEVYIRPISARYMHRKEVERYEEDVSGVQERR